MWWLINFLLWVAVLMSGAGAFWAMPLSANPRHGIPARDAHWTFPLFLVMLLVFLVFAMATTTWWG